MAAFINIQSVVLVLLAIFGCLFDSNRVSGNVDYDQNWQLKKNTVLERSIHMYNNPFMSDIKFSYKNCPPDEELYAHKYMLATSSPVFHKMFYGDSARNSRVIDLHDISKDTVKAFLIFLYKDECPKDIGIIFEVLRLTKTYEIPSFDVACRSDLEQNITATVAFEFIDKFLELGEHTMTEVCWRQIDERTDNFFASDYFLKIKQSTLDALLARDTLSCDEMAVFEAVIKWADHQCLLQEYEANRENRRGILGDAIYKIRFHTMTASKFPRLSAREKLLTNDEIVDLLAAMNGENVKGLQIKWDLSKQKREMQDYFIKSHLNIPANPRQLPIQRHPHVTHQNSPTFHQQRIPQMSKLIVYQEHKTTNGRRNEVLVQLIQLINDLHSQIFLEKGNFL